MDLRILLDIARKSILTSFDNSLLLNKEFYLNNFKDLNKISASFVTLTIDERLRGCIGTLQAKKMLYDDVFDNAKLSAFKDPRFKALSYQEYLKIKIEISVLTPFKKLDYSNMADLKEKLIPNKHGVILRYKNANATYLPQVWEQIPVFEDFINSLCAKAKLDPSILDETPDIYTYEALKVKE